MPAQDRRTALCEQDPPLVTGIDFIRVVDPHDQHLLQVFFLIDPDDLDDPIIDNAALPADAAPETVTIVSVSGGERLAEVEVVRATYLEVPFDGETRTVLEVEAAEPGDFSIYRLTIVDEPQRRVDRHFNGIDFSFKQGCPSDLDCKAVLECPPDERVDFPIDYLARDFVSLRNALLDFSAQRYPQWSERIEADAGVMLAEVMAALGDELSYVQDRYGREAYLETASQRRSLRWLTRLVDYPIHDGLSATTVLDITVSAAALQGFVDAGARVWSQRAGERPIPFEVGEGFADQRAGRQFWVNAAWNAMPAHVPDAAEPCLPIGATELFLRGHFPLAGQLPPPEPGADPVPPESFWIGRLMVLKATPEDPSLPVRRRFVRIVEVEQTEDPLCPDTDADPINPPPLAITRLRWEDDQALPFELCLPDTAVAANIVPAIAGETFEEHFVIHENEAIPASPDGPVPAAVERDGPCNELTDRRGTIFLHSLSGTETRGLGWTGTLPRAEPEVEIEEIDPATLAPFPTARLWRFRRSLLDSLRFDRDFTLDDGSWRRIIGFERLGRTIEHLDYASGAGFTVRFSDGEFGRTPADGTVFLARYRSGDGSRANLPADSITSLTDPEPDPAAPPPPTITLAEAVSNPFAVTSGTDPEDPALIKQLAPEAFRAVTFRAVRDEDYREIAERLDWVQRAGARARWTGSWLTEFVTPDPLGSFELSEERRSELENLIDCVRQAGREAYVRDPVFVSIDLEIEVCVEPTAYPGQVKERIIEALTGRPRPDGTLSFFDPDNFTFGTPLRRSALEAAIQAVPGVRGVEDIRIRARGITAWRAFEEASFEVSEDRILRLQNDPRFPERGALIVRMPVRV